MWNVSLKISYTKTNQTLGSCVCQQRISNAETFFPMLEKNHSNVMYWINSSRLSIFKVKWSQFSINICIVSFVLASFHFSSFACNNIVMFFNISISIDSKYFWRKNIGNVCAYYRVDANYNCAFSIRIWICRRVQQVKDLQRQQCSLDWWSVIKFEWWHFENALCLRPNTKHTFDT